MKLRKDDWIDLFFGPGLLCVSILSFVGAMTYDSTPLLMLATGTGTLAIISILVIMQDRSW